MKNIFVYVTYNDIVRVYEIFQLDLSIFETYLIFIKFDCVIEYKFTEKNPKLEISLKALK